MARAFQPLMPLDDAWRQLQTSVQAHLAAEPLQTETVDSALALGRVLATAVRSGVAVPPLDNSAMDGYALRLADLSAAVDGALPVAQRIAAGQVGEPLQPGSCARIFTGAPVPPGADAVVMQEQTEVVTDAAGVNRVRFTQHLTQPIQPGQNIRRRGEDIAEGDTVLQAGRVLGAAALGVAASVGAAALTVFKPPRVAILTTGNELVMPGQPLPPGAIYNSNRHTLRGLAQACGAQVSDLGIVPDELAATRAALRAAAEDHALIVTSGGVSAGEEDHLRAAVQAEGELNFWSLAIKPGKPFVFGRVRRSDGSHALYMGLPGNPVASYVTFLLLVRPVLGLLAGQGWHLPRAQMRPAAFSWPRADKRREWLRAALDASGAVTVHPQQGSGVLSAAAWADGLVDLPPSTTVAPGDLVAYVPLSEALQPAEAVRQMGAS